MEHANHRLIRAIASLVVWPLLAAAANAQQLWPGMENYLRIDLIPTAYDVRSVELTNLYAFGLVAVSWDIQCDGSARHRGSGDAALAFANAVAQGSTFPAGSAGVGCTGGITAAIFTDGKELGDPAVLRQMHNCRKAAWEELHRTLKEDILAVPFSRWDIDSGLGKLRARRAEFPTSISVDHQVPEHEDDRVCRMQTLDYLTSIIADYRSDMVKDPSKYPKRAESFLRYLAGWEGALTSATYPPAHWWKLD